MLMSSEENWILGVGKRNVKISYVEYFNINIFFLLEIDLYYRKLSRVSHKAQLAQYKVSNTSLAVRFFFSFRVQHSHFSSCFTSDEMKWHEKLSATYFFDVLKKKSNSLFILQQSPCRKCPREQFVCTIWWSKWMRERNWKFVRKHLDNPKNLRSN